MSMLKLRLISLFSDWKLHYWFLARFQYVNNYFIGSFPLVPQHPPPPRLVGAYYLHPPPRRTCRFYILIFYVMARALWLGGGGYTKWKDPCYHAFSIYQPKYHYCVIIISLYKILLLSCSSPDLASLGTAGKITSHHVTPKNVTSPVFSHCRSQTCKRKSNVQMKWILNKENNLVSRKINRVFQIVQIAWNRVKAVWNYCESRSTTFGCW